jgi:FAD:protein FMN transferase
MTAAPAGDTGTRTFTALGTFASLLVTDRDSLDLAFGLLAGELLAVDLACSRFRADSELWQVNHARGHPVGISRLLTQALATALTAARITDGDVDPTCGRSLARLGYDRDFARARQDTTELAAPPAPAAGWQTVELDTERCTVRVPATVMLDLGATAKALAADRAAGRISAAAGCGVLVNLGGDIRVAGDPPARGWRVGILDDMVCAATGGQAGPGGPGQAVTVRDGGLATSSTRARAWQRGGARLHHIIVPGTGLPVDSCWRTVSVAAATCVDANTASTAAILRGERAVRWLEELRLPARLVRQDGTTVLTGGWPADPSDPTDPSDLTEPADLTEPTDLTEPGDLTEPADLTRPGAQA